MRNSITPVIIADQINMLTMATASAKDLKAQKACRLTDEPIPKDFHKTVETKIIKARVKMLFQQPFFGTLISRLQIFPADSWLPTMAVDGKYMYYNHAF